MAFTIALVLPLRHSMSRCSLTKRPRGLVVSSLFGRIVAIVAAMTFDHILT